MSSTPPRWGGGGVPKFFFFCDLEVLRALPLEPPDEPRAGLCALAMQRMLAEEIPRVNEGVTVSRPRREGNPHAARARKC